VDQADDAPNLNMTFYLLGVIGGSYIWEDVNMILRDLPFIGNKEYRLVPYKKVISMDASPIPSDGVIYSPVLATFREEKDQKMKQLSRHYFFKTCPTMDVCFGDLKNLCKTKQVVFLDDKMFKDSVHAFAAYNESANTMPFIYEVSVYDNVGVEKFVVTHVRMDKNKPDLEIKGAQRSARNDKGIFYFTKMGDSYYDAVKNFFSMLSPRRKTILMISMVNQDQFFLSLVNMLWKKFGDKDGIMSLNALDVYAFLKSITGSEQAMFFIELCVKNNSVGTDCDYKNKKIVTTFMFNMSKCNSEYKKTIVDSKTSNLPIVTAQKLY